MKLETPRAEEESTHEEDESRVGKLARAALVGVALSVGSAPSAEAVGPSEATRVEAGIEKMKSYTLSLEGEGKESLAIEVPMYPLFAKRVVINGKEQHVRKIDSGRSAGTVVRLILENEDEVLSDYGRVSYFRKKAICDLSNKEDCFDVFE